MESTYFDDYTIMIVLEQKENVPSLDRLDLDLGQTFLTIVKVSGIYCSLANEDILLEWHIERQVIFKILCSIPKIS